MGLIIRGLALACFAFFVSACAAEQEEVNSQSIYYCPKISMFLEFSDNRARGEAILDGLADGGGGVMMTIAVEVCDDVDAYCRNLTVSGGGEMRLVVPKNFKRNPIDIQGAFITSQPIGDDASGGREFRAWDNILHYEKLKYGYYIRDGKLESFFGINPLNPENTSGGESCYLWAGDGLFGRISDVTVLE